jgi:thymidylate synthase (FAD)
LAESTRYCNYSKDKFGNELTFIQPCWDIRGSNYIDFLQHAEWGYFRMLKNGWTPQQARSVLPLGIKSELISCGFKDAWENFFKRRDAPDAHPMAQEIANPMHKEFFKLTKAEWLSQL